MSTIAVLPPGKDTIDVPNAQLDDLQFEASTGGLIHTDTSDGSDTKSIILSGGGASGTNRGAQLFVFGNEHAIDPGALIADTGGNGRIILRTQGTGNLEMYTNNTLRIYLNSNTDELLPRTSSAISIGSTSLTFSGVYANNFMTASSNLALGTTTAHNVTIKTSNVDRWLFSSDKLAGGSSITNNGYFLQINGNADDNTVAINCAVSRPALAFLRQSSYKAMIFTDGGGFVTGWSDALVCRAGSSGGVFLVPTATGWSAVSDVRRKKNIKKFNAKYTDLMNIDTIKFSYNNDDETTKERVGFSAQNLLTVWPEAVSIGNDAENTLSIQFDLLIPYIIATMKDMIKDIQKTNKKTRQLEMRIEQLLNTDIPDDA